MLRKVADAKGCPNLARREMEASAFPAGVAALGQNRETSKRENVVCYSAQRGVMHSSKKSLLKALLPKSRYGAQRTGIGGRVAVPAARAEAAPPSDQPAYALSRSAMTIFFIFIMACMARSAFLRSGSLR
jgi:hypothetical protein